METFELKYKITDADIKSVNKKMMLFYFILYLAVALVGIAIGIVAVVLSPQKLMFVLGIILLVLGGILLACALLLLIAPKNFVASAVTPSDDDLTVNVDENGITVKSDNVDNVIPFRDVTGVKEKKGMLYVYVGKAVILLVKNAIVSGGELSALYKFIYARQNGVTNPVLAKSNEQASEDVQYNTDENK